MRNRKWLQFLNTLGAGEQVVRVDTASRSCIALSHTCVDP